jgi:hypothetical protein
MANQDKNVQNGVQGSSYLYDFGTSPNTRTAVSQKIRILAPAYGSSALSQVGVVSSFGPSQSKTIENVRGVGFGDRVAELVPGVTEPVTGDMERALLYLCNLWQATGYASGVDGPVRSLAHHRWPFDIEVQMVFSTLADNDLGVANEGLAGQAGTFQGGLSQVQYGAVTNDFNSNPGNSRGHTAIITMYEACWFNGHSSSIAKDTAIMMETGSVTVTDVHDFSTMYGEFLATGNDPTVGQYGSVRFA